MDLRSMMANSMIFQEIVPGRPPPRRVANRRAAELEQFPDDDGEQPEFDQVQDESRGCYDVVEVSLNLDQVGPLGMAGHPMVKSVSL